MPLLEFEPCRDRIARAKGHNKAFSEAWNDFVEDDPYRAVVHMEDDGTGGIWVEPSYSPLPTDFALELGEFLYNLRAALDHCVYAAAILETGQCPPPNEQALEFPICDSPSDFKKAGWKISPLTGQRRLIIESIQPYNAVKGLAPERLVLSPHRTLAILNDWARKDRHRRLHVVGSWVSNASPALRIPQGTSLAYLMVTGDGLLENESQIASFRIDGWKRGMKIEANPDLAIDIALDEVPPPAADNDTLGNRLMWMELLVQEVVRATEASFS